MRISIRRGALAGAALTLMAIPGLSQDKAGPFPGGKPVEMTALFGAASASTLGVVVYASP